MESIQQYVLEWSMNASDDDAFVEKLKELVEEKGAKGCQAIMRALTDLNLGSNEAAKVWKAVLAHHQEMKTLLNRKVKLNTAMCDYLCSHSNSIKNPKLVEINTFAKVVKESTHDSLTGLCNRAYFSEALEHQILLSKRHGSDLSVLFIDVDDFKDINDTYGHKSGDDVLIRIADVIRQESRTSDVVARYGGEEFVVLMPQTDYISALVLAERIRLKVDKEKFAVDEEVCHLTVSGGIASFPIHAQTSDELLHLADSAVYRAKGSGKNNVSLFKEDKRRFLRTKLNSAVQIKEMGFHVSPTLSGKSKDICIGGILFENEESLPIGAMIQVSILIGQGEPTLLIGTVVRVEAYGPNAYDIGMAISFKEMEKSAKDEISKFLLMQAEKLV